VFESPQEQNIPLLQPPIEFVPGALFPGSKLSEHEANHSPPSNAKVRNGEYIPPLPPYVFMASPGQLCLRFTSKPVIRIRKQYKVVVVSRTAILPCSLLVIRACLRVAISRSAVRICADFPAHSHNAILQQWKAWMVKIAQNLNRFSIKLLKTKGNPPSPAPNRNRQPVMLISTHANKLYP
jgi:hypothetical protein